MNKKYPKESLATKRNYTLIVKYKGTFDDFVMGIAQSGDPKGTIELRCPEGTVKIKGIGHDLFQRYPMNLKSGKGLIQLLKEKAEEKFGTSIDSETLEDIGKQALAQYTELEFWDSSVLPAFYVQDWVGSYPLRWD